MILTRLCLPLLAALILSGCTTLPQSGDASAERSDSSGPSPYALEAPKRKSPSLIPRGPLLELPTLNSRPTASVAPLEPPKDLWERIRRGFAMPDLEDDHVRDREQWYASRPDYMQRMTERGSKYLFHIVEELERRNLPLELALLPYIESAFNPQAVSTAKAAGMWQFMPATGKSFDLKQNAFRDDRRDVLASTRAALDYLERLYKMFGDWHLALAAYNWGEGSVMRAIQRNEKAGLGKSYTELRMPAETRYYVPKLQAVKNIVANPQRYNTRLPNIGNHPFFDTVTITRDMDVAIIAQWADVQEKDFRQLNPSHNKPVIMAAGTPTILLPWDNAHLFEDKQRQHTGGSLASWTVWKVPKDMTPAEVAQHHGMTEAEVRDINKIPPRMVLKAGSSVMVPRQGQHQADVPMHLADHGQILLAPQRPDPPKKVKIRAGDTLASLADKHNVTVEQLRQWNKLGVKAKVKTGQTLLLAPTAKPTSAAATAEGKKTASAPRSSSKKRGTTKADAKPSRKTTLSTQTATKKVMAKR